MNKPTLHTILSPQLLNIYDVNNSIVVIIDVFRATSTIATALYHGAAKIIPVDSVELCIELGNSTPNSITAGERDGKVIEGLQALNQSLCILSTHLYEISEPLKVYPHIQFCYFETAVIDKTLIFNYNLKKGVSQDRLGYLILEREGVVELIERINT